jgi:hypothetical protein
MLHPERALHADQHPSSHLRRPCCDAAILGGEVLWRARLPGQHGRRLHSLVLERLCIIAPDRPSQLQVLLQIARDDVEDVGAEHRRCVPGRPARGQRPRIALVVKQQQPLQLAWVAPPAGLTQEARREQLSPAAAACCCCSGPTQGPMYGEYTHFAPQQWLSYVRLWPVAGSCVQSSLAYG